MVFFFIYTVITAMVVLSLFISVITAAMFEVMEQTKNERAALSEHNQRSPKQKRARVLRKLQRKGSPSAHYLNVFFASSMNEHEDLPNLSQFTVLAAVHRVCWNMTTSAMFEGLVMCGIGSVAVVEVLDMNGLLTDHHKLEICQIVFTSFFCTEALLKILAQGTQPLIYLRDDWNKYDFCVVVFAAFERIPGFSTIAMDQLLRVALLFRVVKIFNYFPRLHLVTRSLAMSFKQVTWVLLMIVLMNVMFALVAMLMFGLNDPQHFGSFQATAVSIWMIETLDDWDHIMYTNMFGCENYGYYDT
jgi:hypothetical protein